MLGLTFGQDVPLSHLAGGNSSLVEMVLIREQLTVAAKTRLFLILLRLLVDADLVTASVSIDDQLCLIGMHPGLIVTVARVVTLITA